MNMFHSLMNKLHQSNKPKLDIQNNKLHYTNRLNNIHQEEKPVKPIIDMGKELLKVRQSKKTLPLSSTILRLLVMSICFSLNFS